MAALRARLQPSRKARVHAALAGLGLWLFQLTWLPLPTAHAYEDQAGLTFGLGYASAPGSERPPHGALADAAFSVGLDDVFTGRLRADYAFHPGSPRNQHFLGIGVELLYLVDILEWVPYFGVGVAGISWLSAGELQADAGGVLIGGLEYLYERELIFGLDVRGLFPMRAPEGDRAQILVLLTATRLWEL